VSSGALERAAWRHPEWPVAAVAAAAWAVLVLLPGAEGGPSHAHHGEAAPWFSGLPPWLLMATAMMVPAALPAVRYVALTSLWRRRRRAVTLFVVAYLGVWGAFGVLALLAVNGAQGPILLAGVLAAAAAWELTPWKRRSLRACRLIGPLPPRGPRADAACVRAGLSYGGRCVAGCWALMLAMAVAGHTSLLLMALLTVLVTAEKLVPRGGRLGRPASAVLLGAAVTVLVA
jgi:predicted metal-binding membrane protein